MNRSSAQRTAVQRRRRARGRRGADGSSTVAIAPDPMAPAAPMADDVPRRAPARGRQARAGARHLARRGRRPEGWELVREVYPHTGTRGVVGFTGPPGAGKSTLIGALSRTSAREPHVGGALDRPELAVPRRRAARRPDPADRALPRPGVFIRSMATRGALGGWPRRRCRRALLMDAAGKDDVFLETVGVGQAEVDVIDHADTVVLVLIPGSGDSIQALKAGVMEIPDVIVVNKADHPLTDTMVREIRGVLSLAPQAAGACRSSRPRRRRRGRRGARGEARRAPRARRGRGTLSERRRRNLLNEVLGLRRCGCGARWRRRCARTPACRSCSTRSSRGASIPHGGPPRARARGRRQRLNDGRRAAPEPEPERFPGDAPGVSRGAVGQAAPARRAGEEKEERAQTSSLPRPPAAVVVAASTRLPRTRRPAVVVAGLDPAGAAAVMEPWRPWSSRPPTRLRVRFWWRPPSSAVRAR
jgi:LAO/AO transport system kinase